MFWAKQNIAKMEISKIKVIYDQYLKIANLQGITVELGFKNFFCQSHFGS